ncbi:MAG: Crp/Fnr family transcriptional regulator [Gammaproteobacteria bacterium]
MKSFSKNPWFKTLPPDEIEALMAVTRPMKLRKGEFLFHQGDPVNESSDAFFGLVSGSLKFSIFNAAGDEAIVTIIEAGNWIGTGSSLDNLPRAINAIILEDTEILAVDSKNFDVLMQRSHFAVAIAKLLAARLRLVYWLITDSALQTVRERICRRIAILAHGDITQSLDGRDTISISQDNLAMMLGISRPTLNKELQMLGKMGVISLRYGRIEIENMPLLLKEINGHS